MRTERCVMAEMFNRKFEKWFELAREAVKKRPAVVVALNDDEFIEYLNYDMPIAVQMSPDYVTKLALNVPSSVAPENVHYYEAFQKWWKYVRMIQKTEIYEKLKQNGNTTYNRELEILARRFKGWEKKDVQRVINENPVQQDINITFTEDKD